MNEHQAGQVVASAAEIYEQFFVPALFAEWPERLLEAAKVQDGNSVLDVACGTGILTRAAAQHAGETGSATGLDINDGMLAVARQKAPHLEWKIGMAESLPFHHSTFDRVVSQFGLMFFENQVEALLEMSRVLRPGGILGVAVWGRLEETPGYTAVATILAELFGDEIAQSIEMPYSLGDTQLLASLFAQAGMVDVKIQTLMGQARFDSIDAWIYTDIKGWTLADMIDDEQYALLQEVARQRLTQFVLADGSVVFDAPAHIVTYSK